MKKFSILISVLMLAAVVLSACGGANNSNNGNNSANGTPGVITTEETGSGAGAGTAEVTPTLAVTDMVNTPTAEATAGITAAATEAGTPAAAGTEGAIPVTGKETTCTPNLAKKILDYEVVDAAGKTIGKVDSLVIFRDATNYGVGNAAGTPGTAATTVPATTDTPSGAATAAPAVVGNVYPLTPDLTTVKPGANNAKVVYVLVDFDDAAANGDKQMLIPFGAFKALGFDTPTSDCRFVFAKDYKLDTAPAFNKDNLDLTAKDWDQQFRSFWSGLGVDVSAADNSQTLGNPVMLNNKFQDINVKNANGDDLGEVNDFILDPKTGALQYAVLQAGGFLGIGEKNVPVPMNQVIWGNFDDNNNDLGEMIINIPEDAWKSAPTIDDLGKVDYTQAKWDDTIQSYWKSLTK